MSGRLAFSNGGFIDKYVSTDGNDRLVEVGGGGAWNTGAIIRLNDNDSTNDTGAFSLSTGNNIALKGSQNGALTWNGKPVNVGGVYITQTWVSGTSWYRVWSDGYIEQGGYAEGSVPITSTITVTLYKSFSNTNYTIGFAATSSDTSDNTLSVGYGNAYYGTIVFGSKTASSFGLRGYKIHWYAHGF